MILGFDCDNFELDEFDIVRAIWYTYIDFEKQTNIVLRLYCVVCDDNGISYWLTLLSYEVGCRENKIFKYLFNCEKLSKSLRKSLKAGGKQIYAKKF